MKKIILILMGIFCLILSGCSQLKEEAEERDKYYEKQRQLRIEKEKRDTELMGPYRIGCKDTCEGGRTQNSVTKCITDCVGKMSEYNKKP